MNDLVPVHIGDILYRKEFDDNKLADIIAYKVDSVKFDVKTERWLVREKETQLWSYLGEDFAMTEKQTEEFLYLIFKKY